ncbi:MAG: kinase [Hyphomonadaceae bacterium]
MNRDTLNALDQTVAIARARAGGRVPVVGVAGPQGSGKTTLVRACAATLGGVAHFSLDDFYVGKDVRATWARDGHPLLATRGPPPTHDTLGLASTIKRLQQAKPGERTTFPAFDKVKDDVLPEAKWPAFPGRPDLILIDGWCLGALPQTESELVAPANRLEAEDDSEGHWRRLVNKQLSTAYADLFAQLDAILYLRAPDFAIVHDWRCEQEEGLLGRALTSADRQRIARFVQHYERITRHMIAGGRRADIEVQLDARRNVTEVRRLSA